jgi:hypothetical protein
MIERHVLENGEILFLVRVKVTLDGQNAFQVLRKGRNLAHGAHLSEQEAEKWLTEQRGNHLCGPQCSQGGGTVVG